MAVTKLSLFNDALLLVGERKLSSDTEDIPIRHSLDTAYDNPAAADYCLELAKPKFSLLTAKLISPATPTNHSLAFEYSFPADYIAFYRAYSEPELDETIHRYIIEKRTIACDNATNIWLRYVSNAQALTIWTPTFASVVVAFLAKTISPRWAPQKLTTNEDLFLSRLDAAIKLEGIKEEEERPRQSTLTLSTTWRKVYNKAFFILGLNEITTNSDDSIRRIKADAAVGTGIVEAALEDLGWTFALSTQKITFDPSLEPDWGYTRVYQKPNDLHRLDGIFSDEFFNYPLKLYYEEGDQWFCDLDTIYVTYVSTDFLNNPANWPQYFADKIAGYLAVELAPGLAPKMLDDAIEARKRYDNKAGSTDAMRGPPQLIKEGSWVRSRNENRRGATYFGRP